MAVERTVPAGLRARLIRVGGTRPISEGPPVDHPGGPAAGQARVGQQVADPGTTLVAPPRPDLPPGGSLHADPAHPERAHLGGVDQEFAEQETAGRQPAAAAAGADPQPTSSASTSGGPLPLAMVAALADLETAAVVVGPGGAVLTANRAAFAIGIVRRGRVRVPELLEAVRIARVEGRAREVAVPAGWLGRQRPDGAGSPLAARVRPLTGTEVPGAVLLLVEDRTRALRALAARQDFVVNVSHELKTPVGAIALLAEALQEAADDPVAVSRFARRIGVESQRLTRLVKEIVELSRVQLDDPVEHAETVSLADVVASAVDAVGVDADSRSITVETFVPAALTVPGNRADLVSAVANLVGNAVVYSPPGTRVTVTAARVADAPDDGPGRSMVDLAVCDQGLGIDADKLTRVFERFFRVDEARSRATGGTGLGLSIVKHVATAHGGSIRVWSVPGTGSTFTLRLPLSEPAGAASTGLGAAARLSDDGPVARLSDRGPAAGLSDHGAAATRP